MGMGGVFAIPSADYVKPEKSPEKPREWLTDREIDKAYRILRSERGLSTSLPNHKKLLTDRGLDDAAIANAGYFSHVPNTETSVKINIPGVKNGRLIGRNGVFLPSQLATGGIVGAQIMTGKKSGKYVYLTDATQIREYTGNLQFIGLPAFRKAEVTHQRLRLFTFTSLSEGRGHVGVSAGLFDPTSILVAEAGKHFNYSFRLQAQMQSLLLGLQMALEVGVEHLELCKVSEDVRNVLKGQGDGLIHPEIKFLSRLVRSALDAQANYSFEDAEGRIPSSVPKLAAIAKDSPTNSGDRFWDSRGVWLVDGALKATTTAEKWQKVVIGTPGGMHAGAPDFRDNLFAMGCERVYHLPDAGDVVNKSNVPATNKETHKKVDEFGYPLQVGWWGQVEKEVGDIDDISTDTEIKWITSQEFFDLHPSATQKSLKKEYRRSGIYKVDKPAKTPRAAVKYRKPQGFKVEDRLPLIQSLIKRGKRFIHEASPAGSGKSHFFSTLDPVKDFGAYQVIYASSNPITLEDAFAHWHQYRSRDEGRLVRPDGLVVRAKGKTPEGEALLFESNCVRAPLADFLATKSVVPSVDRVCVGCPMAETCKTTEGWYQHDRKVTLAQPLVRVHPNSIGKELIRTNDGRIWDKVKKDDKVPGTVIILDDVDPFISSVEVTESDIRTAIFDYLTFLENVPAIRKSMGALADLLQNYKTLKHDAIVEKLPKFDLEGKEEAIRNLYEFEDYCINRAFNTGSAKAKETHPPKWIGAFIEALTTEGAEMHLSSPKGRKVRLTITLKNKRLIEALNHPGVVAVIISDATGKTEWLEKWVGQPFTPIAQELDKGADLEVVQVTGLGDLGYTRSEKQKEGVKSLKKYIAVTHPEFAAIELKAENNPEDFAEGVALSWRSTSRGSNAAEKKEGIVLYGVPRENLDAAEARYSLMANRHPELGADLTVYPVNWTNEGAHVRVVRESADDGFAEFCHQNVIAELQQGLSRLRHVRRPGEKLTIWLVNEYPLEDLGLPVRRVKVEDILNQEGWQDKATASSLTEDWINFGSTAITLQGRKLTQKRLAQSLGTTTSAIAEYFRVAGRDWKTFKESFKVDPALVVA
jgi:hypothetical protein